MERRPPMTEMTKQTQARTSAEIIPFRRRAETAEAPKPAKTVPWCGGWYHEVAIAEEPVPMPKRGPAA